MINTSDTDPRDPIDPSYAAPPGFETVLNYRNDPNGVPVVGQIRLALPGNVEIRFSVEHPAKTIPALPLRGFGELWSVGWDCPLGWAIDAVGECWASGWHGGCLCHVESRMLLAEAEEYEPRQGIRKLLGMEKEKPDWQKAAEAAGWTPPPRREL